MVTLPSTGWVIVASTDWVTVATLGPSALLLMHSHPGKRWSIRDAPPWSSGGIWDRPRVAGRCPHPLWQGGPGLCWPSSCLGKCRAGCGPAAGPGAAAGATLGTPGRNALRPSSNRFIRFWGRSAGCVRSGDAAAASSLCSSRFSSPAGKVGKPGGWERVSSWGWGVQDAHCPKEASASLFPALQVPWG